MCHNIDLKLFSVYFKTIIRVDAGWRCLTYLFFRPNINEVFQLSQEDTRVGCHRHRVSRNPACVMWLQDQDSPEKGLEYQNWSISTFQLDFVGTRVQGYTSTKLNYQWGSGDRVKGRKSCCDTRDIPYSTRPDVTVLIRLHPGDSSKCPQHSPLGLTQFDQLSCRFALCKWSKFIWLCQEIFQ